MNGPIEEWRPVVGYEGRYEVSSMGGVRKTDGTLLSQYSKEGYMRVRLSGPRTMARVHRLVAGAFIQNPDGLPFVNHLDCDTENNAASNLEWCTQRHNIRYAASLGHMVREKNRKLTSEQAADVRSLHATGRFTPTELAARFNVCRATVDSILGGRRYLEPEAFLTPPDSKGGEA